MNIFNIKLFCIKQIIKKKKNKQNNPKRMNLSNLVKNSSEIISEIKLSICIKYYRSILNIAIQFFCYKQLTTINHESQKGQLSGQI